MPRGYELNSYYDAYRAIHRRIYSTEIKRFSSLLKKCQFNNSDIYAVMISNINKGLYDNLDLLYNKTHFTNNPKQYIGLNKSSNDQDFMSPMELRMNSIAVRNAINNLIRTKNPSNLQLSEIEEICYMSAQSVAHEFRSLIQGEDEFNMRITGSILSSKPILKKYDESLIKGTLPKGKEYEYDLDKMDKKKELVEQNKKLFFKIKEKLIELGMTDPTYRQKAFAKLNQGYYCMDISKTHLLEITKILISNNMDNFVGYTELLMNQDKLSMALETLNSMPTGVSDSIVYKELTKIGAKARQIVIRKHRQLPELYGGFYCTYVDADKRITTNKTIAKEHNDKMTNNK